MSTPYVTLNRRTVNDIERVVSNYDRLLQRTQDDRLVQRWRSVNADIFRAINTADECSDPSCANRGRYEVTVEGHRGQRHLCGTHKNAYLRFLEGYSPRTVIITDLNEYTR